MQRIERTFTIKAPVHKVFDCLCDPVNFVDFWPEMLLVEDVRGLHNGGKCFRWTAKVVGVRFEGTSEDTEYRLDSHIVSQIKGGLHGVLSWNLEHEDDGTKLHVVFEYAIPVSLHSRPASSVAETMERDFGGFLSNLTLKSELGISTHARS